MQPKIIVITGGPCSGKTTIQRALIEEFPGKLLAVPEMATLLLDNGFYELGKQLGWSEEWQALLEYAVYHAQIAFEKTFLLLAQMKGQHLVCDRGRMDAAGYTPGGISQFCQLFGVTESEVLSNYDLVIHLESLATADPERYEKRSNAARFEPLKKAQAIEMALRAAWQSHPKRFFIPGQNRVEDKIAEVMKIVRPLVSEV